MRLPSVDFHIHTLFCGHAADDMDVPHIIQAARSAHLDAIAVSDHVAKPGWGGVQERIARQINADDRRPPRVSVGAEVDLDPMQDKGCLIAPVVAGTWPVVAAMHWFPRSHRMWYDTPPEDWGGPEALARCYIRKMCEVVREATVHVIAHPGIMAHVSGFIGCWDEAAMDAFDPLLHVCAEHGVAFELNELVRSKVDAAFARSYHRLFAAARERGVRISLGSDAHAPQFVGRYDFAKRVAGQAGLTDEDFLRFRENLESPKKESRT